MKKFALVAPAVAVVALVAWHGSSRAAGPQRFGIYRGVVTANADPQQASRLQVEIPVLGTNDRPWAMPCAPYVNGAAPPVPPIGSKVWIEFEGGDMANPVWVGWRP